MAKIIQFQQIDSCIYWLTEDGNLFRRRSGGFCEQLEPRTGRWKPVK